MPRDSNSPFTPGLVVPVEFFVGRLPEIERLRLKVEASATRGRLGVAFLTGERGIGKSSLGTFVRVLTERDFGVLGIHVFLGGVDSLQEMVQRVFSILVRESVEKPWYEKVSGLFGTHIKKVGLFNIGVEFDAPPDDLRRLLDDFASVVRDLLARLKDDKRALLLILDDIDDLAKSREFANWLKSLVDGVAASQQPLNLCLLLVGLEDFRHQLVESQPSLARVFDLVEIRPWSDDEQRSFFVETFEKVGISVMEDAEGMLSHFAGGLPVLAHEVGDAAYTLDTDNKIDMSEAAAAVVHAAEVVGHKLLDPQVFAAVRSSRYRSILRRIATRTSAFTSFTRAQVLDGLPSEEKRVLDNFLGKMKELGVLMSDPEGGPGSYKFVNRLHALYFAMEAKVAEQRPPAADGKKDGDSNG